MRTSHRLRRLAQTVSNIVMLNSFQHLLRFRNKFGMTLLLFISLNSYFCAAQTWVTIPDANFVTYLQSIIPGAMSGNQMNTSSSLVTSGTQTITVSGKSISNLSGIQYFTSLTYLDCSSNSLTNLPTLPNGLAYLFCESNHLSSLPSLPNSLLYLNCGSNSLGNLPTLSSSLQELACSYNSFSSLPTLPNTLQTLYCDYNSLNNLPTLPNSLQRLICNNDGLTSLPTLPNALTFIYCYNNSLITLPALPDSIGTLWCHNNNIGCFSTFPNTLEYLIIDPNPYNCLPNYIGAMNAADLAKPLCAAGNTNGCAVAGIEQITGINSQISVYPNPAKDIINVKGLAINEETYIQVMDMFGNFVMEYIISDKAKDIDVSSLNEGVYNLSITNKEGRINKKLVIVN